MPRLILITVKWEIDNMNFLVFVFLVIYFTQVGYALFCLALAPELLKSKRDFLMLFIPLYSLLKKLKNSYDKLE